MLEPRQQERKDPTKKLLKELEDRLPATVSPEDAVCTFRHVSGGDARHVFRSLPTALLERCMIHGTRRWSRSLRMKARTDA